MFLFCFTKIFNQAFLHDSHIWFWRFLYILGCSGPWCGKAAVAVWRRRRRLSKWRGVGCIWCCCEMMKNLPQWASGKLQNCFWWCRKSSFFYGAPQCRRRAFATSTATAVAWSSTNTPCYTLFKSEKALIFAVSDLYKFSLVVYF